MHPVSPRYSRWVTGVQCQGRYTSTAGTGTGTSVTQDCGSETINFGSGSDFPVNYGSGSGADFQIILDPGSDPDPTFYILLDPDPDPFRNRHIFYMNKKFTFFQFFSSSILNSFKC